MGHLLLTSLTLASLIADAHRRFEAALVLLIAGVAWVIASVPWTLVQLVRTPSHVTQGTAVHANRPIALRIAGGHFALLSSFSHWALLQENGGNPALLASLAFSSVGLILAFCSGLIGLRLSRHVSRSHRNGS